MMIICIKMSKRTPISNNLKLVPTLFLNVFFLVGLSHLATYIFLILPELGAGIDPGMAFNPFPSSILDKTRQDLKPQPLDRESSPLTTRPDLRPLVLRREGGWKKEPICGKME